jgi:hypothetical protein
MKINCRNYYSHKDKIPNTNITVSEKTRKSVIDTIEVLTHTEAKWRNKINFRDVFYNVVPIFDEKTHNLPFWNEYKYIGESKEINPNEVFERFNKFDINTLPLIEVAEYLKIKVRKSSKLKTLGSFYHKTKKIILGTDYPPVFLHELAHAIDFIFQESPESLEYEKNLDDVKGYIILYMDHFSELLAELSAVVLCKIYNIPIDLSSAKYYLNHFSNYDINVKDLITGVSEICEYVNKCVENIENKKLFYSGNS